MPESETSKRITRIVKTADKLISELKKLIQEAKGLKESQEDEEKKSE